MFYCFIILNYALTAVFADTISLNSGDFAIIIEKSEAPVAGKPVIYKLILKNKYDGSLQSGAEIKIESYFAKKNISNITILKEESAGVYVGSVVFSEKGPWNIAVLGTIKQDLGVYPFRSAFNENVEIQTSENINNNSGGGYYPNNYNNNADEGLVYYKDEEQKSDFGVVFVFSVIVIVALLAAFYPKFRK